jgi:DNA-binding NtrC family response regulator
LQDGTNREDEMLMALPDQKRVEDSRILLVEDDSEMRRLLVDELTDEGFQVSEAVDGEDALARIAKEEFDLVVTDLVMPRLGGLDLLAKMKKACPVTPVILITAFGDWSSLTQAYEKGAVNYLCKPFRIKDLKDAIQKALKKEQSD